MITLALAGCGEGQPRDAEPRTGKTPRTATATPREAAGATPRGAVVAPRTADRVHVRSRRRRGCVRESHPVWTPDGRLAFLEHGDSGPVQIRVVDLDGGEVHDLPVDAVFVFDWGPL